MHSVLVYHTISAPPEPLPGDIDISRERFAQQLQWLSRWRRVARLEETLSPATNRLVAITFDDGYRDNLTVALPLLEKFRLPMTLFVAAGFVGREGYLSEEELREIAKHPLVTIGAHGMSHRHFTRLKPGEARFELLESRRLLESITGQAIDLMAWPYGECNAELEELSKQSGYRAAWSVWQGTNTAHSLWRVPLGRRDNMVRFIAKVSGAYFPTKFLEKKLARLRGFHGSAAPQGGKALPYRTRPIDFEARPQIQTEAQPQNQKQQLPVRHSLTALGSGRAAETLSKRS